MNNFKPQKGNPCVLYDRVCTECGECMMCDLDPNKVCDNCGKCLEEMMPETNKKGFVEIPVEFEKDPDNDEDENQDALKEFLKSYGLADTKESSTCDDDDCDCGECHEEHDHKHHTHNSCNCSSHNHHNNCSCTNHKHAKK